MDFEQSAQTVARELLGKYLVRRVGGKTTAYMIVETEAYHGTKDKASKARHGRTKHNDPMWGPAGKWYVYFTYGMHYMLNLVTGKDNVPSAVLIRAVELEEPAKPYRLVRTNKPIRNGRVEVKLNGPAKLTKALQIDKRLNGKPVGSASGLWIEDRGVRIPKARIKRTPRIGIPSAKEWVEKPLRYIVVK